MSKGMVPKKHYNDKKYRTGYDAIDWGKGKKDNQKKEPNTGSLKINNQFIL